MIEEAERHLAELQGDQKQTLEDNEWAKREGFSVVDTAWFNRALPETEEIIAVLKSLKQQFNDHVIRSEDLRQKIKELLMKPGRDERKN